MAPSPRITLPRHRDLFLIPMHKQKQKARNSKEDTIHDSERKARLQHITRFVCTCIERLIPTDAIRS